MVEVKERDVVISALELERAPGSRDVAFHVGCSKGTYIRSLANDLVRQHNGQALSGCMFQCRARVMCMCQISLALGAQFANGHCHQAMAWLQSTHLSMGWARMWQLCTLCGGQQLREMPVCRLRFRLR